MEWISVKDRLPKPEKLVLCANLRKDGRLVIYTGRYHEYFNERTQSIEHIWIVQNRVKNIVLWTEITPLPRVSKRSI